MSNKKPAFFIQFLVLFATIFTVFGCANQQPPHGGPKDVTPPRLLKASPPNMTRHFNAKYVKLDFDEYFKLTNQYTEITMSPSPDKQPEIKRKDKSIVITFKDTLQKNTTYVINFGKAIQDVNEGNTLLNFTYVFSTGPHIDSLSVSGTVINSLTQKKEKDITVMLIPVEKDTAYFGKKKPNIYATTDTAGNFSMNNLHEGNYYIYALKETSQVPSRIYKEGDLIAFLKKPIHLYSDTSDIQLTLFQEEAAKFRPVVKKFDDDGKILMIFNKPLQNPSLKIIYPKDFDNQKLVEFTKTRDTAYLWSKNMDFDSLRVAILNNNKPIDSISFEKGRKEPFKTLFTYSFNLTNGYLKPTNDLVMTTNFPIDSYDESLITLTEDSSVVSNVIITKDSTQRKLSIKYRWKPDSRYVITFDDGALTNIFGVKNKKKLQKFQIDNPNNYANLNLHVTVPDTTKSYIVEFYVDPKHVLQQNVITKNTVIIYKNYVNGKYYIRVVYDDNKNGKWDTGNVKKRLYPENIWIDPNQETLRPNFDVDDNLAIPREQMQP
jgi:hypothetical protein